MSAKFTVTRLGNPFALEVSQVNLHSITELTHFYEAGFCSFVVSVLEFEFVTLPLHLVGLSLYPVS